MPFTDYLIGGSSATVITTGIGALLTRGLKRAAADIAREANKELVEDLQALTVKVAKETGGNSNGLRQAVNALADQVHAAAQDIAFIKGLLHVPAANPVQSVVVANPNPPTEAA